MGWFLTSTVNIWKFAVQLPRRSVGATFLNKNYKQIL